MTLGRAGRSARHMTWGGAGRMALSVARHRAWGRARHRAWGRARRVGLDPRVDPAVGMAFQGLER